MYVRSRKDDDLGGESRFEGTASGVAERAVAARKELVAELVARREFVEERAVAKSAAKRVH